MSRFEPLNNFANPCLNWSQYADASNGSFLAEILESLLLLLFDFDPLVREATEVSSCALRASAICICSSSLTKPLLIAGEMCKRMEWTEQNFLNFLFVELFWFLFTEPD